MLVIKLNKSEYVYLAHAPFLTEELKALLIHAVPQNNDRYLLTLSEEKADELRDLCGEQLQRVGFDEKYDPTLEGKMLESLIDKFFPG